MHTPLPRLLLAIDGKVDFIKTSNPQIFGKKAPDESPVMNSWQEFKKKHKQKYQDKSGNK